jgi:hypothetical protein
LYRARAPGPRACSRDPPGCTRTRPRFARIGVVEDRTYRHRGCPRPRPYAGVGLNLTELPDRTAFSGSLRGGRTHWFATELLRYVQVPGTAALGELHTWRP